MVEAGLRALMPGDRDGPVEGDDGGRGQCEQLVVEQAHLAPVGLLERRRLVVQRGDRGLDGPAVRRVVSEGLRGQPGALVDHRGIPQAAVLVFQRDGAAMVIDPGRTSGVSEQHEREQASDPGLAGHQPVQDTGEPDGLVHQIAPHQVVVAGGRVALGEDEVDDVQNQAQTAFELVRAGHAERDAALLDLALAAGQALGHGRRRDQEGLGDLSGAEARDVAQGESGLRVQVESGVTAREHELQPVVGDVLVLGDRLGAAGRIGIGVQRGELGGQRGVPPDTVERLAPRRGGQPG